MWRGLGGLGTVGGLACPSKDCGDVGSPSSCVLGIWGRSGCSETIQGLWNCGGSERGSGTTTPYKLHEQTPAHRGRLVGGVGSEQSLPESEEFLPESEQLCGSGCSEEGFCRGLRTSRTTFRGCEGGLERSEQLCGSGCSGTIQRLGKVLQGSDVQGWEGVWKGLGDLRQSGGVG